MRQFMHRAFWLNDPDCLLLGDRENGLTKNERELYALAAGALDGMIVDSDRLSLLGQAEKNLLRVALGLRGGRARVSGLMGEFGEGVYRIGSSGGPAGDIRLGVNLSEKEADMGGKTLPPRSGAFLG